MSERHADPSIVQVRALVRVAEHGSIAGAARAARTHRSTVWHQMDRLQAKLGVRLVERVTPEEVRLTAHALALLEPARMLLEAANAFDRAVAQARDNQIGDLRMGAYPTHVTQFLARAATKFLEQDAYRSWRVSFPRISEDQRATAGDALLTSLIAGELDVAVASSRERVAPRISQRDLYSWRLVAVGRDFARHANGQIAIEDVAEHELLVSPEGHTSRVLLEREFVHLGLKPRIAVESRSVETLIALAEHGHGIALVPDDNLAGDLRVGVRRIVRARGSNRAVGGTHALYWRESPDDHARDAAVGSLVQCVIEASQHLREGRQR